jgi:hypothetical protein
MGMEGKGDGTYFPFGLVSAVYTFYTTSLDF